MIAKKATITSIIAIDLPKWMWYIEKVEQICYYNVNIYGERIKARCRNLFAREAIMAVFKLSAFADEASKNFSEQIKALAENGLSTLEIRGVNGTNIANITPAEAKEIRKQLDDAGIKVGALGSPLGKIAITDPFAPERDKLCRLLELCDILGTSRIRMFSFYIPKTEDPEIYFDEVGERLNGFLETAKGSGVTLCHENEKGIYGDIASRCLRIHKALPELKGVYDPANYLQCGEDTLAAYDAVAPYLEYIHIKDAAHDGNIYPAGSGDCNITELLRRCAANGHTELTAEPHLKVFSGLEALETSAGAGLSFEKGKAFAHHYTTNREAFDAAISALKTVIENSGNQY